MHKSQPIPGTIEFLNITQINPLISKCKIKVCYVGDEPNRNRSIITEDAARQIAQSLPGSPIVGYFNNEKNDFEEHNRYYQIKNGRIIVNSNTRPYGFVDTNAKVWFEEYLDDDTFTRKYMVTEGYIWTGQYPEAKSMIEGAGKPHSLEFCEDERYLNAFWTKDEKGHNQFFIINEAVIEKLCVLGSDIEPCFEGSSVTHFTLEPEFKNTVYSLITEMKNTLNKGVLEMEKEAIVYSAAEEEVKDASALEYAKKKEDEEKEKKEESASSEEKKNDTKEEKSDDNKEKEEKTSDDKEKDSNKKEDEEDKKKLQFNLEEAPEFLALKQEIENLKTSYAALEQEKSSLEAFKNEVETAKKQELIKSFYMLSEEDKKDVNDNIMSYSYDEIKAKLCVIGHDKGVSFAKEAEAETANDARDALTYNLKGDASAESKPQKPEWLKSVDKNIGR